jgi:hypothetical protein
MSESCKFYRWWPTITTLIVGFLIILAGSYGCGFLFINHDIAVIMSALWGIGAGYAVGQIACLIHERRNLW